MLPNTSGDSELNLASISLNSGNASRFVRELKSYPTTLFKRIFERRLEPSLDLPIEREYSFGFLQNSSTPIVGRPGYSAPSSNLIGEWNYGKEVLEELQKVELVRLDEVLGVLPIFAPTESSTEATYSIKFGITQSIRPHCVPLNQKSTLLVYTVHLNPNIRGRKAAFGVVEEALLELKMDAAWKLIQNCTSQMNEVPTIVDFLFELELSVKVVRITFALSSWSNIKLMLEVCTNQDVIGLGKKLMNENEFSSSGSSNLCQSKPIKVCLQFDLEQDRGLSSVPACRLELATSGKVGRGRLNTPKVLQFLLNSKVLSTEQVQRLRLFCHSILSISLSSTGILCHFSGLDYPTLSKCMDSVPFVFQPFKTKTVELIHCSTRTERIEWIQKAHYNVLMLKSNEIMLDFLTDSSTGAMSTGQMACLLTAEETYSHGMAEDKFQTTVQALSSFPYVFPVHQARAGEKLLFTILGGQGKTIPSNAHFNTTRKSIEFTGANAVDLASPGGKFYFQGNIDIEGLRTCFKTEDVPLVILTLTNNMNFGHPVSMENIEGVSEACKTHGKLFFIDACRIAENAICIKEREEGYENHSVKYIVHKILSLADGMTMSARKDGLANTGGWIACRDADLATKIQNFVFLTEGFNTSGGLAGRDLEAVAKGVEEVVDENYLRNRLYSTAEFGEMLMAVGVPVVEPVAPHVICIDAGEILTHLKQEQFPAQALSVALYLEGGIRSCPFGRLMYGVKYSGQEIVRLAIPRRVYSENHFQYTKQIFSRLFCSKSEILGLRIPALTASSAAPFMTKLEYDK